MDLPLFIGWVYLPCCWSVKVPKAFVMQADVLVHAVARIPKAFMVQAGVLVHAVAKVPKSFMMRAVVGLMQWLHDLRALTNLV